MVEMDNWDSDFLDLVEEVHLIFQGKSDGEIAFGVLKRFLDVRYGTRDGSACAEFSREEHDDNDPSHGRGCVMIGSAGRLVGHFYHPQWRPGSRRMGYWRPKPSAAAQVSSGGWLDGQGAWLRQGCMYRGSAETE